MATGSIDQPWLSLPAEIVPVIRPTLPDLVEEIIRAIREGVPAYARPFEGRFGQAVRRGTEVALSSFLGLVGTSRPPLTDEARDVYTTLGRGEVRQGRTLDSLLAAYRVGTRVTLRRFSEAAMRAGYDATVIVALSESVLAYIEEVSSASAQGFAFEQSERAGETDRRRVEVLELILRGQADEVAVQQAAAAAGWAVPATMVAVLLPPEEAAGGRLALGPRAIVAAREADAVALAPAPGSGRDRRALEIALHDRGAVVGPPRDWSRVPESLRLAVSASAVLLPEGAPVRRPGDPLWVQDHLTDIVLGAEAGALADLGARRLAPFSTLRPGARAKLEQTLLAWLRHWGQRAPVADELGIHPQTVGYRVAQLRELFGDDLEDPQVRFELELVLRARPAPADPG
ncbi:helix-turn-helix domain-containing protein [Lapillicoccus jejuensis]|uniref:PucR-like helix-turn-helix protein n=1 Tax=Lapillicoccus jejuensis TaxID=402171 RepID=A0A542E149_9MICO|nr:PucR-like helix-turn-helix protein [Lapillicoccus jejuensis]